MCGIAGKLNFQGVEPSAVAQVREMLALLRHRGPDEFGIYADDLAVLGSARLSIIDLAGGQQPIGNEDGRYWIVFNGAIFNYQELREELEEGGHQFSTQTDTEVILHLYEELGPQCLERLNGQWALAIWDASERRLFLARDRLGVRPLFYTRTPGGWLFASEAKGLFADDEVRAEIDPAVLEEVFTYWAPLGPRSIFRGVKEVPPGHYMVIDEDEAELRCYWNFTVDSTVNRTPEEYLEELRDLLVDAVRIRMRADVPVGAYLSGGLDSSLLAAIVRKEMDNQLETFSVAFTDAEFDESAQQRQMVEFLRTTHHETQATQAEIGRVFPEVIWHTECPILRTAPAPMYMLSAAVRERGLKVVLTGEGADEFFGGYDIFKEAKARRFWAQQPESKFRPKLLEKLYPEIASLGRSNSAYRAAFFGQGLGETASPFYSHALRWRNNRRNLRFFSDETKAAQAEAPAPDLTAMLPPDFNQWEPLAQAQFLEVKTFLSNYLLNSQGDRMAMAHSVEGRYPFLDWRVVEFSARLPARLKLRAMSEKYLLRVFGRDYLPPAIAQRRKQPYRAPIHRSFFNEAKLDYVTELLSESSLKAAGFFKPTAVQPLLRRIQTGGTIGETDDMALAGILSTQLLHHHFIGNFRGAPPFGASVKIKYCGPAARQLEAVI
jgi:asparagine synthase (glutamine-hydrolysing)